MPTYEYTCRECGEHLEIVQSFHDDPLTTCEACGGRLRKVFNAAGIIFKGSGYYVTDTRAERDKATSGSSSNGQSDSSSDSSGAKSGSADNGSGSSDGKSSSSDSSSASGSKSDSGSSGSSTKKSSGSESAA